MGNVKNFLDPAGLVHDNGPRNFSNLAKNMLMVNAPLSYGVGTKVQGAIARHYNTANNDRGLTDPAQIFGQNMQQPTPFDPNAPGSVFNRQSPQGPYINPLTNMRQGYTGTPTLATPYGQPGAAPAGGMPAPGTPTNGLQGQPTNGLMSGAPNSIQQGGVTNGLQAQPNWASIIGRALRQ